MDVALILIITFRNKYQFILLQMFCFFIVNKVRGQILYYLIVILILHEFRAGVLYAIAVRLLCKIWAMTGWAFPNLQVRMHFQLDVKTLFF